MSELFADRYNIQHELGRGAFGVVYLAHDVRLRNRSVALKVLHPALSTDPGVVRLFENEAGVLAGLRHDHIITVYDVGVWELRRYIVMDYVAGPSLAQVVKEQGAQPPERVQAWLRQAAEALAYAHGQGVLHRDVKSANLLLETARDRLFVSDFGLARAAEASGGSSAQSDAHLLTGTAAYRAPEVHRTGHSAASDLYGLGVVGYELLAGRRPFLDDDPLSLLLLHATEPVPPLPAGTPAPLTALVMALLAKDPTQRPASAEAVVELLADSEIAAAPPSQEATPLPADLPPVKPPPVSSTSQPSERPPRRWLGWLAGGVALVVVLLLAVWALSRPPGAAQPLLSEVTAPATATVRLPAATSIPPTSTPVPSTDTPLALTDTPIPPTDTPAPPTDTPIPPTNTPMPPTDTPIPSISAFMLLTDTPFLPSPTPLPSAVISTQNANLRAGPGTVYATLGSYPQGTALVVTGKSEDGDWLQMEAPDGKAGWMARSLLQVNTNLEEVKVATAPPTPTPATAASSDMVFVPDGDFLMGSPEGQGEYDERPQHLVYLDAFYIDKTEVTVAQYQRCVEDGGCRAPEQISSLGSLCNYGVEGKSDHPINCMNHWQARGYCSWAGKRLPTEAEWEKAARGTDGRIYPWGNSDPWQDCTKAQIQYCNGQRTIPVGSKPAGASPYGALDMTGNVWEWVADGYNARFYIFLEHRRNPVGDSGNSMGVLRGGAYDYAAGLRAADRHGVSQINPSRSELPMYGFRCARLP